MSTIRELDGAEALARVDELAEVLRDCVEGGASVGFMLPLAQGRPQAFWRKVAAGVAAGERHLFVAEDEGESHAAVRVDRRLSGRDHPESTLGRFLRFAGIER